ncbi:Auxin response factor 6 [Zea mays]|jgi:hypothetical protein|uniref:Auxin response factor 6 n=1 Tax=Zea mays TaxID=4577 RepID=A0A1D6QSL6_MAIZE|nr:Auxin response factor 6 [Zea mays]
MPSAQMFFFPEAEEHKCLNSELWHACAGPLVSLPSVGSRVVYFPQGHGEQVTLLPWTSDCHEIRHKYCRLYLGVNTVNNVSLVWS